MSKTGNKPNLGLVVVIAAVASTGGLLFGFPWAGCVDHPGMHH